MARPTLIAHALFLLTSAAWLMSTAPAAQPPAETPEQIIKDLERARPTTPAPAVSPPANQPQAPADTQATTGTKLLREGTFLTARRGRVARGVTGELLFTFDADAQGRSDGPMVLLPCMNLAGMEKILDRAGESVTFTLSGQVFVYKGRNYILPTLYQVNRRGGDVNTAQ